MVDVTLDPQIRRWLDSLPAPEPFAPPSSLAEMRASSDVWPWGDRPEVAQVADMEAAWGSISVPVRIYWPLGGESHGTTVFLHGGGWVLGGIELADGMCRRLANDAATVVVNVGYRLAPEHPFPEPLEDVEAVVRWVDAQADHLGTRGPIAIAGESAGGNLAAGTTLRLIEAGGPSLIHQTLIYPVLDHDFDRPSMLRNAEGFGLTRAAMEWFWDQYAPNPDERDHPHLSPRNARPDLLARVPSTTIAVAGHDPLCDEGTEYAGLLTGAGVEVELLSYPGQIHGFVALPDQLDGGRQAWEAIVRRLRTALRS